MYSGAFSRHIMRLQAEGGFGNISQTEMKRIEERQYKTRMGLAWMAKVEKLREDFPALKWKGGPLGRVRAVKKLRNGKEASG